MFNFFKKIIKKDENPQENLTPEISSIEEDNNELKETIEKTGQNLVSNFLNLFNSSNKIDDDTLDEMEESLIKADLGVTTSAEIIDNLRAQKNSITQDNLKDFLKNLQKQL